MKANQPALLEEVQRLCDQEAPTDRHQTVDVARSRHETRLVEVFDATGRLTCEQWQPFITALIRVSRRRFERNAKTGLWNEASEISYHVCNAKFSAQGAGAAIRAHWGIGVSKTATITRVTSQWAKTLAGCAKTQVSWPASEALPPTS